MAASNVFEETMENLLREFRLGTWLVGDKLPAERELATRLTVSRATLRQVLEELQAAGIVEVSRGRYGGTRLIQTPQQGTGEDPVDAGELTDALATREIYDVLAATRAAQATLTAQQRGELVSLLRSCTTCAPAEYRPQDSRFHLGISALACPPSIQRATAVVRDRVNVLLDRIPLVPTNITHANDQHAQLLDAVFAGDPHKAAQIAESHARGTASLLMGFLASK